jgi:hypothetical protein
LLKDPSVTDPKNKALYLLTKALKAGLDKGRLMQGKPGRPGALNYRLVTKPNRRKVWRTTRCPSGPSCSTTNYSFQMLAKYLKNKRNVEYKDTDDFSKVRPPRPGVDVTPPHVSGEKGDKDGDCCHGQGGHGQGSHGQAGHCKDVH